MMNTKLGLGVYGAWSRLWLLMVLGWGFVSVLQAQTTNIYWVGGASTNWSDAANWRVAGSDESRVPGVHDIVHLGYAEYVVNGTTNTITDTAQTIHLDVTGEDYFIHSLNLEPTGNRSVSLTGYTIGVTNATGITMTPAATANAMVGMVARRYALVWSTAVLDYVYVTADGTFRNDSPAAELTMSTSYLRTRRGIGTVRLTGPLYSHAGGNNAAYFYDGGTNIVAAPAFVDTGGSKRLRIYDAPTFYLTQNSETPAQYNEGALVYWGVMESDEDVTMDIRASLYGSALGTQVIVPNPDGSQGNLIMEVRRMSIPDFEFVTIAGSIISLNPNFNDTEANARIVYADNPGISGGGSLLHNATTAARVFTIERTMTYTGRTMLQRGILRLGTHIENEGEPEEQTFYGQLPEATIVELGVNATLDLAGVNQTIGGLTGFIDRHHPVGATNAAGTVLLGGGTLTINAAATNTSFAGTIAGEGALVKRGAETFTLAGGYTNTAGRTLRVEEGLLAVTGALAIEEGAFELTGGYVTAGTLSTTGLTWNVTLGAGYEEAILVDVTDADITGAALILALANGYTPEIGTKFTLLRAGEEILGAGPGGILFGYQDGQEFQQSGLWYTLDWNGGSETIVLTVIPEPGSLLLLVLPAAGLLLRRRSRKTLS